MIILYGIENNAIDITQICLTELRHNNIIIIPSGDHNRAIYFTDPLPGILKSIFIINETLNESIWYDVTCSIKINIIDNTITTTSTNDPELNNKIKNIHSNLQIKYGSFNEELPEQLMAVRYLNGNEKVLEIGGNIGRNSLVIAEILKNNNNNFVTLECDSQIAVQLTENRDLNNFNFHIENSALSNRKLIQCGWNTIPSDTLQDGYNWVKTISLNELQTKYNIEFDTLVLDCEGAFYYILRDMPEILNNINLIIMENDYTNITHKQYIDTVLTKHNFYRDYVEHLWWGGMPCSHNFFEVWKL